MKCPRCRRHGVKQGELFWCVRCQALYDEDPSEGGDYSDNPSRRLERQEEREEREREKKPFNRRR